MTIDKANVEFCIKLMERAKNLDMERFQAPGSDAMHFFEASTIEELHDCRNTACFYGYLQLTEEFKEFLPRPNRKFRATPAGNLSEFLGISLNKASGFIYGTSELYSEGFYPVPFPEVTTQHIIAKLRELL